MLDPRIYRTGFVAVALAVVVVAFSLVDQPGSLGSTLAPDAFNGPSAYAMMNSLAQDNPNRRPGSTGDDDVATYVAAKLKAYGYGVSTGVSTGRTVDGRRTLETVTGVRAGLSTGSIVVIAPRDSLSSPAPAAMSATAALLELARVLAGETQHRTIVLASISGSAGLAGATRLAQTLPGPVDAVISLGDLAGTRSREPVVVPWSTGQDVAPPLLRNTVAAALSGQAGLSSGGLGLSGQFAHLAFPLTLSNQGPFGARGVAAVSLSLAGDHPVAGSEATSPDRLTALGRSVLQAVTALDTGAQIPRPSPYLLFSGKVVPAWAIRLLALALVMPVLLATIDGLARVRRRGYSLSRGIAWALARSIPFLVAVLILVAARLLSVLAAVPPGPAAPGDIPLRGAAIAVVVVIALVLVGLSWAVHRLARRRRSPHGPTGAARAPLDPARGVGVLIVMAVVTLAIWVLNPFAAILVIPALHLWMWLLDGELRPHPALSAALLLAGLLPPALLVLSYANSLGFGPGELVWNGLLLIAGGQVTVVAVVQWSLLLGCVVGAVVFAVQTLRQPRPEDAPVTVRGPVSYAGPGSLGGTESALRR